MKKRYLNGMKAVVLSGLMGLASLAHAQVAYNEQIILQNSTLNVPIGGNSVSMDGEWAAVGAYDETNPNSCFVTMFRLNYATMQWVEHSTLGDNTGNCTANKGFGSAISLSGTEMVVGLANYATNGGSNNNGGAFSAYAYDSVSNTWNLIFDRIRPLKTDGTSDIQPLGGFGLSVNIQEGILVVGAPKYDGTAGVDVGKVYIYERPDPFNPIVTALTPRVTVEGDQAGSMFGSAVAGSRQTILVGVSLYDQGGFTNNGAGFMYEYNASTPSLTKIGELYGTASNEKLGLQLEHTGAYAAVSGNLRSFGYRFNGSAWQRGLTLEGTLGGDVDIIDNVGALAKKGSFVNLYPLLDRNLDSYFLPIVPTGTPGSEFAEDISLYQNQLVVSEFGNNRARFYTMPCGYGGALTENEWTMVNVPCKISGQTVNSIFGDDGLGIYDTNWVVYEQNASNYSGRSADAVKLTESSPIVQGKSYWIIADANSTWKVDSTISTTQTDLNTTLVPNQDVVAGTYPIALPIADQNLSGDAFAKVMVGNPFPRSFEWANVQYYSVSDGNISLSVAKTSNYMESTAYIYDSSVASGQPYTAVTATPGVGTNTVPENTGFWIKILEGAVAGDKLLIPLEK